MLTTASKYTSRGRHPYTQCAATTRAFGGLVKAGLRHRQQTRGFRFGIWSSCLDDDFWREIRRRQRSIKREHSAQINRRLPWEKHPFAGESRHALKRMMKSYWHNAQPGDRFCDDAEPLKETSSNKHGVRPGQNIEDVERGALDHLIFGEEDEPGPAPEYGSKKHEQKRRNQWKDRPTPSTSYGYPVEQDDFFIDPITNRKVSKLPSAGKLDDGVDIPVKTSKSYRSQFVEPGEIPQQRNESLQRPSRNEERTREYGSRNYKYSQDLRKLKPETEKAAPVFAESATYDDLLRYKPFQDLELDDNLTSNTEELFNDRDSSNDHKHALDEVHDKFDDLKPPHQNEEAGTYRPLVADELASRLQNAEAHEAEEAASEVGGAEEVEPRFNGLGQYDSSEHGNQALGFNEEFVTPEVLRQYRSSIEDQKSDHFPQSTAEDLRAKYDEAEWERSASADSVDPKIETDPTKLGLNEQCDDVRRFNDPYIRDVINGDYRPYSATPSPEEFAEYGPYYYNEPDGKPLPAEKKLSDDAIFVRTYDEPCRFDHPEWKASRSEEESKFGDQLSEAQEHDSLILNSERNGQSSQLEEVMERHFEKQVDLHNEHEPIRSDETFSTTGEELGHIFKDLEPEAYSESTATQEGTDAHVHEAGFLSSKQNKGFVSGHEALDQLNSVFRGQGRKTTSLHNTSPEEPGNPSMSYTERLEKPEQLCSVKQGDGIQSRYWETLETSAKEHEQLSNAHDEEAALAVKSAKAKSEQDDVPRRNLTGNYVRDFPEEFEKNWSQTLSSIPSAGAETSYETEAPAESERMEGGLEGGFGQPEPSKIQPALDRHNSYMAGVENDDASSNEPLETLYIKECGDPTQQPIFNEYGTASGVRDSKSKAGEETSRVANEGSTDAVDKPKAASRETIAVPKSEPFRYKILAYDATMQKINVAETSSMVPEFRSALSPADALLRVSNPTKFFPYFANLEAEGFEIVSGSGEVLIFRKARPSKIAERSATEATDEPYIYPYVNDAPSINPIDMTGRVASPASPASANFASPTGYVKYENLPETVASTLPPPPPPPQPQPSRVAYNINLRREEPVYSGPKYKRYGKQKKRTMSIGKRLLVGGVWVAGISYGLGVVSEYFTTGGVDGLGPQGL